MGYAARKKAQEAELALAKRREWEELPETFFPTYWPADVEASKVPLPPYHWDLAACRCLLCVTRFWYPQNYWYVYTILSCPD